MSLQDYNESKNISREAHSFHSLLMATMRQADTFNFEKLNAAFPTEAQELKDRYNAPGGILPTEKKVGIGNVPTSHIVGEEDPESQLLHATADAATAAARAAAAAERIVQGHEDHARTL